MKQVQITQGLVRAWEVWYAEVPEDFPSDGTQLEKIVWLNEHAEEIVWGSMKDSGFDATEINEVEEE